MLQLIALSAAVSLVTLAVLFIQRIRPRRVLIPSYFLGQKGHKRLAQLKTIPPRWWEWLLVVCATCATGLAYNAHIQPSPETQAQGQGLVWFDPTLSHVISLRESQSARDAAVEALKDMHVSEYVFITLVFEPDSSNIPRAKYNFRKVNPSQLSEFIRQAINSPSALSQPLDGDGLAQAVKAELKLDPSRTTLTLLTDGQAETLRPLGALQQTFEGVRVLRTPPSANHLQGRRTAIVPEELAQVWSRSASGDSGNALPGNPNFVRVSGQLAGLIPPQARPTLSLEEFNSNSNRDNNKETADSDFALIVSEEAKNNESKNANRNSQPLLTTCTLAIAGPAELDGLADLRAYAQFFQIPVRPHACRSTESSASARSSESTDPWKYRRASIWVVPVNDSVAGELFQQGLYWTPEGFAPDTDALIYIADTRLQGNDSLLESQSVQLEENQPTIRLPLLPLPPHPLIFPWELSGAAPAAKPRPISTQRALAKNSLPTNPTPSDKAATEKNVLLKAADGTPLAYKLSDAPPVVYLRTGGAAPNGELGRWGQWAALWTQLSRKLSKRSPLLTRVQLRTPADWTEWMESQKKQQQPELRYKVSALTLKGEIVEMRKQALQPDPALYIRERDDQMVLVEPPAAERQSELMSPTDLEQLFPRKKMTNRVNSDLPPRAGGLQILGALLAFASLLTLWLLQGRRASNASLLLTAFVVGTAASFTTPALAESNKRTPLDLRTLRGADSRPQIPNPPFRIAWCDANIPQPVKDRYSKLQTILAGRGTIELPKELTPGACRAGAAEVWWSSSLEALQAAQVTQHIRSGGVVIAEGIQLRQTPEWMLASADPSIGLVWESPKRRGLLYRSFYLLSSFDGCTPERTLVLTLRKKVNALAPMGIVTPVRFLTNTSEGGDCFIGDDDYRIRAFVNLMYALLTTDYKEDQMQLPEILNRVRNLGLEP